PAVAPGDRSRRVSGVVMLEAVRGALNYLREKHVLHRLGVVLSLLIIGAAFYVLYHKLKNIDPGILLQAIRDTDMRDVGIAALAVAAGYFTLTFYDLFALRTIGRFDVPY